MKLISGVAVVVLALAVVFATPGQLLGSEDVGGFGVNGERGPRENGCLNGEDLDEFHERKDEIREEKIDTLIEEEAISQEEGEELLDALEERASFERGTCLETGERNCDVNLELRERFNGDEEETRRGFGFGKRGLGQGQNR